MRVAFYILIGAIAGTVVYLYMSSKKESVDIVMLGDSHVELVDSLGGTNWSSLLNQKSIKTLGFSGYTSDLLINGQGAPLQSALDLSPKQVVLVIGANDVDKRVPIDVAMRNIKHICTALRDAKIEVIVCTVPPVTGEYNETIGEGDFQERAIEFNKVVAAFCKRESIEIFDLHALLIGGNTVQGSVLPDAFSADGIHLNPAGYQIWGKALRDFMGK